MDVNKLVFRFVKGQLFHPYPAACVNRIREDRNILF